MKKVALLTFFSTENYGAILQALALQEVIKNMGYEVDLIDYNPKSNLSGLKKVKNVVWRKVRFFLGVKRRWKRTDYFRVNYLNINNDRHAKFLCLGCNCNIWQYDKYVVDPTDVSCTSQNTDGRREITLITCTNDSKQRVIVKAREI